MTTSSKTIEISLDKWQQDILIASNGKRFVTASIGRQSGKTYLAVAFIILKALQNIKSINWWIAPTYGPSKMAFRRALEFLNINKIPYDVNRSDLRITFQGGSVIDFKSGDREEGLRGESVDFMVIDEIGLIKRDVWDYALRGTITATKGQVFFIGTPKGKNLFYELFQAGQDDSQPEFISFQHPSNISAFFPDSEWELVKQLPERVFRQEYQAEFLDDGGEVFRNIRGCIQGGLEQYKTSKQYYAGIDLAKTVDYSVICILDENAHLVAFDRFKDVAWTIQKERIKKLVSQYRAFCYLDSTGVGDPVLDDLLASGLPVQGYKFTSTSKRQLIEKLSIAVERNEISFPEIPELINELNIFAFEQLPSGGMRYSAPSGLHDDIVIALALAYFAHGGYGFQLNTVSDKADRIMIGGEDRVFHADDRIKQDW